MLLFLKNVERLSVWEWQPGEEAPVCQAEARIDAVTDDLRRKRNFVSLQMQSQVRCCCWALSSSYDPLLITYAHECGHALRAYRGPSRVNHLPGWVDPYQPVS
jgi:hypothetical protein